MAGFVDHPAILFVVLFALFIAAVAFGLFFLRRVAPLRDDERDDSNAVQGAMLTLMACFPNTRQPDIVRWISWLGILITALPVC
ncbi:hypothetical protein [Caballeronia sp. INDeC2]|uniref:hypothetical protein n=1 Tax=Caballeronia sp. INDeC2 TaxID=2921747 RepID=UPI00202870F1|nr:hypothetical protein [Caballeronia sp. INDeC2]